MQVQPNVIICKPYQADIARRIVAAKPETISGETLTQILNLLGIEQDVCRYSVRIDGEARKAEVTIERSFRCIEGPPQKPTPPDPINDPCDLAHNKTYQALDDAGRNEFIAKGYQHIR